MSAFCVGIVLAVYFAFKEYLTFVLGSAAIIAAVFLMLNGFIYFDEDFKKQEERLMKEIEQLEREIKQQPDEAEKEQYHADDSKRKQKGEKKK